MKRKFLVFRNKQGATDGGPLPEQENELQEGGAGNAEKTGANEQANASRGNEPGEQQTEGPDTLASGQPAPDYYRKAQEEKARKAQ